MARLILSALAILASTSLVAAMPAPAADEAAQPFSVERWVDGILADPNGDHLSPEEAAEQYAKHGSRSLDKRATCYDDRSAPAPEGDAIACIQQLAAKGDTQCLIKSASSRFCEIGAAAIDGRSEGSVFNVWAPCSQVAQAAGRIMDACFRSDRTVKGWEAVDAVNSDKKIVVALHGK
ncbi:hypothetical protein FALBO_16068 [Fusarium albosuccineum]|uniref:Ecp2 effector protein domain-containing protein n=1 Tax=Fusarium albosuccineum TaxID=1237068 RepID=A0A8H4KMN1_9HYPO|nr:hypothetical protein FALBO_16068 [Fusarium albosuccineum]